MPLKEDYVHDAVMHIRQAIAMLENPSMNDSKWQMVYFRTAVHESLSQHPEYEEKYYDIYTMVFLVRNREQIDILKSCVSKLHESIGYNQPLENPNQLTITFDGKQNPDNQN
jgi:hypothetical protein